MLDSLYRDPTYCDCQLVVPGQPALPAHAAVLAASSPGLRLALLGAWVEAGEPVTIILPGGSHQEAATFIQHCYQQLGGQEVVVGPAKVEVLLKEEKEKTVKREPVEEEDEPASQYLGHQELSEFINDDSDEDDDWIAAHQFLDDGSDNDVKPKLKKRKLLREKKIKKSRKKRSYSEEDEEDLFGDHLNGDDDVKKEKVKKPRKKRQFKKLPDEYKSGMCEYCNVEYKYLRNHMSDKHYEEAKEKYQLRGSSFPQVPTQDLVCIVHSWSRCVPTVERPSSLGGRRRATLATSIRNPQTIRCSGQRWPGSISSREWRNSSASSRLWSSRRLKIHHR